MSIDDLNAVDTSQWQLIGSTSDFGAEVKVFNVESRRIAVRMENGEITACLARCPHGAYVMENPEVHDTLVTCPLHGWRFDMSRGGCEIHGYEGLRRLNVRVVDDNVYLDISK